jgi:hypothetical protein
MSIAMFGHLFSTPCLCYQNRINKAYDLSFTVDFSKLWPQMFRTSLRSLQVCCEVHNDNNSFTSGTNQALCLQIGLWIPIWISKLCNKLANFATKFWTFVVKVWVLCIYLLFFCTYLWNMNVKLYSLFFYSMVILLGILLGLILQYVNNIP